MKAVVIAEHGGLDKLEMREVDTPRPSRGEVLVRVKACSVNHLDIWLRQGIPAYRLSLPHVCGSDVAGVVEEVGEEVEGISVGERVVLSPGVSCYRCRPCMEGKDNLCEDYRIRGAGTWGGYAEYAVARAVDVHPIPDGLSFEEAAAFPLTFLTAWHMLMTRACLRAGEDVLVIGAGSGVGSAAVKIAKLAGARVFATAGREDKRRKALEIGADEAIDHSSGDFSEVVRELTGGRGVDVVFEHVGPATWERSLRSLKKGGRLVTCGATTGPEVSIDLRFVFSREFSILGSIMGTRKEFLTILDLVGRGALRPVIDSTFPLEEAARAQERMLKRESFGKILLLP